jgi:8-oxo-dGTP pyrophosphatase MutT (NUDIX family)
MIAAGALIYASNTHRFLFLLRNNTRTRSTWGLPGGKIHEDENVMTGLNRELLEELGNIPTIQKYIPLETFTSFDSEFRYHSFIFIIESEFLPTLNKEHGGYAWADLNRFPRPLHPGLFQTISIKVIREKIKLIENSN